MLKRSLVLAVLAFVATPLPALAQTHACDTATVTSQTIPVGKTFTVQWCVPSTAIVNGVEVPMRINGTTVQIDTATPTEAGVPVSGTPSASKQQLYSYLTQSGIPTAGTHQVKVTPWNYKLNPDDTPTTERQPAPTVTISFEVVNPVMPGAPPAPTKGRVIR